MGNYEHEMDKLGHNDNNAIRRGKEVATDEDEPSPLIKTDEEFFFDNAAPYLKMIYSGDTIYFTLPKGESISSDQTEDGTTQSTAGPGFYDRTCGGHKHNQIR